MNLERYEYTAQKSFLIFEFISDGPNGSILKVIQYDEVVMKGFYNLALGDKDLETGKINDLSVSNNGDSVKILATVVASLYEFTDHIPHAWIGATGSTSSRTRLYRMGISKYLTEIQKDFELYGFANDRWEVFEKQVNYEGFLAKRKIK